MAAELPELEELRALALDLAAPLDRRQGAARLWFDVARAAGLDLAWTPPGRGADAGELAGVLLALPDDPEPEAAGPAP